ncbi:MAG TPA: response regulator [Pyrinomonadaceae bacterium]|nr:response regulator [Pyrinomonadaceae bacterium]
MSSSSPAPDSSPGYLVLVVEDTPDTRELIKIVLELSGYQVVEAERGDEAVEVAVETHPDAIIMDMSLPVFDGCQAARTIRRQPGLEHVPIIACTAHNRWEWRAKAIVAGCDEFLEKPIDFERLGSMLSRHIRAA